MACHAFLDLGTNRPCFSPDGEFLSFASPKERNQRKGDPCYAGLRLPCDARHTGRRRNSPWRAAHNAAHCGAQTHDAFSPRVTALLGDLEGSFPDAQSISLSSSWSFLSTWINHRFPLAESPNRSEWTGRKRNPVRVPQWGAFCATRQGELVERPSVRFDSGTRRAMKSGGLLFGYFFLATQEKTTRHQAKSTVSYYSRSHT